MDVWITLSRAESHRIVRELAALLVRNTLVLSQPEGLTLGKRRVEERSDDTQVKSTHKK